MKKMLALLLVLVLALSVLPGAALARPGDQIDIPDYMDVRLVGNGNNMTIFVTVNGETEVVPRQGQGTFFQTSTLSTGHIIELRVQGNTLRHFVVIFTPILCPLCEVRLGECVDCVYVEWVGIDCFGGPNSGTAGVGFQYSYTFPHPTFVRPDGSPQPLSFGSAVDRWEIEVQNSGVWTTTRTQRHLLHNRTIPIDMHSAILVEFGECTLGGNAIVRVRFIIGLETEMNGNPYRINVDNLSFPRYGFMLPWAHQSDACC
jgi:hypothetical protein